MSNCQSCGYELDAGSAFCWGCGSNSPFGASKKAKSGNNKSGKIVLIVVGVVAGLVLSFLGASFVISNLQSGPSQTAVIPTPTPTPTQSSDDGFSKQNTP